jgi:YidC/Oxa1 family membrane protein insertase
MDKNTIIGFVLIAVILIGFSVWSQPSEEERAKIAHQDSIAMIARQKAEKASKEAAKKQISVSKYKEVNDTTVPFYKALNGKAVNIILRNKHLVLTLNSNGGTVDKAVIQNFENHYNEISKKGKKSGHGVVLFEGKNQKLNYTFETKESNIETKSLYFVPSNVSDTTVTFTADAGGGKKIAISYLLSNNYILHSKINVEGMGGMFVHNTNTIDVDWVDKCRQQERGFTFENRYAMLTYHLVDGGTDHINENKAKTDEPVDKKIDWIAFKNQFFSAVMISKNNFAENSLMTSIPQQKGSGYLKQYGAKMKAFFDPTGKTPTEFDFYYGPNDFRLLQKTEKVVKFNKNLQLERLVYLGWPLFRLINRWFTIYVFDFLTGMNINMGIVLILITLLLKLITYPLVKKSYMSSAKMRVLKPKLDEATKQYDGPDSQMQKQQAMMTEYAKYGVSPLSGCLPMLIQMPIWIAMFNFVPNAIQLRGESFLWIKDLSTYDPVFEWGKNIWMLGDHLSLTCILFCVANVLYSWMTMRLQKDQMVGQQADQMKMMQWMMYLMPLIFFFMFNDYSSGLNFYYFVSLFFSAAIMWTLRKTTNDKKLLAILESRYNTNKQNPKKMSGFAARLQAMQEQQAEMQRKREDLERKKKK